MTRDRRWQLAMALLALSAGIGSADSPVTSTPFSDAYLDYGIVKQAKEAGVVGDDTAAYLADPENPIDVKAAVCCALGWSVDGKHNAEVYCRLRGLSRDGLPEPGTLEGDQALVVGYLALLDDYNDPERALPYLRRAVSERPDSLTVAIVHAIARGQRVFPNADHWPRIWLLAERVLSDESLNGDMRVGAIRIITDYLKLYRR